MDVRYLTAAAAALALVATAAEAQMSRPLQSVPGGQQINQLQSLVTQGAVIHLGGFGFGGFGGMPVPYIVGDQGYGGGLPYGAAPPMVINAPAPPPAPLQVAQRPEVEERPTVETTRQGVTIVRGPGSHHLDR